MNYARIIFVYISFNFEKAITEHNHQIKISNEEESLKKTWYKGATLLFLFEIIYIAYSAYKSHILDWS